MGSYCNERWVSYVRISVDENGENASSIENQIKMIEAFALEHGKKIIKHYIDDGISGYDFNNRPAFEEMCKDIENDVIDTIVSKDLSRIGRHNAHTLLFIEEIKRAGKRLILINEGSGGYDTSKDEDDILGIKTWYNERYVKDISAKIRGNIETMQKSGKFIIKPPYGYKCDPKDKHAIIIDEETAEIVKLIFKLYIEGNGYRKIADILNEKGIPTPSQIVAQQYEEIGKSYKFAVTDKWSMMQIQRIIKNDLYIGVHRYGKTKRITIKGKVKKIPKEDQIIFENHHPAIIDKKVFELAQQLSDKRNKLNYRGGKKHDNVFSGFLFCKDCGSYMIAFNRSNKPRTYICGNYHRHGVNGGCSTHRIAEAKLAFTFKEFLIDAGNKLESYIKELNQDVSSKMTKIDNFYNTLNRLRNELTQVNNELKVLIGQKIKDISKSDPEYRSIIEEQYELIEKEKVTRVKLLNTQIKDIEDLKNKSEDVEKYVKTALDVFKSIIEKEVPSKLDLELVLDKVIVDKDGVPTFKLKDNIDTICTHNQVVEIAHWLKSFSKRIMSHKAV